MPIIVIIIILLPLAPIVIPFMAPWIIYEVFFNPKDSDEDDEQNS